MKKNVGKTDRLIRLILAIVFVGLYYAGFLPNPFDLIALVLAAVMLFTSFMNFCPLYLPFGIKTTNKTEE